MTNLFGVNSLFSLLKGLHWIGLGKLQGFFNRFWIEVSNLILFGFILRNFKY